MSKPLGRRPPTDWNHVSAYPLTAATLPDGPVPVVLGINWYEEFFTPYKKPDGRWWLPTTNLGWVAGGHAICVKPGILTDPAEWWTFYNQGNEGSCVGFSESRMMSLLNRTRYGGRWLYQEAQLIDEWDETPPEEGTSVRAGLEILRTRGHRRLIGGVLQTIRPTDGIKAYRWAQSVDEVHQAIKMPLADSMGAIPLLNSWGRDFPHVCWMADEVLDRLLKEDGEAAIPTDL